MNKPIKNKSMQLLEKWCSLNGWVCKQIPEKEVRTPDYKVIVGGKVIYAEVKEIIASDEEKKVINQLSERGWADAYGEKPGRTIRI